MARRATLVAACCLLLCCTGLASAFRFPALKRCSGTTNTCAPGEQCVLGFCKQCGETRIEGDCKAPNAPFRVCSGSRTSSADTSFLSLSGNTAGCRFPVDTDVCVADNCPAGTFCVDVTGVCVEGCRKDPDCEDGEQCVLGKCKACGEINTDTCQAPGNPLQQRVCSASATGKYFSLSGPTKGCVYDVPQECGSCEAGTICSFKGVCEEGCSSDAECEAEEQCILGKCRTCGTPQITPENGCKLPRSPLDVKVCSGKRVPDTVFETVWQCKFPVDSDCDERVCTEGEECSETLGVCVPTTATP